MSSYWFIVLCLLVIPVPVPIRSSEAKDQKLKMPLKEDVFGHVHRLYNAYRERIKGEGDDAEGDVKVKPKDQVPLQRDLTSVTRKTVQPVVIENTPIIKFDATDDRSMPPGKCLARLPNQSKEVPKGNGKPEVKTPVLGSMILVKLKVPEKMLQTKQPEKPQDSGERRIYELNRIYNDFLKAWQKPVPSLPPKPLSSSGSQRLSALFELMDVIERLQKSDLVKELAQKINQEMEPNLQNQIKQDTLLVTESRASLKAIKKNDLSGLFENVEPRSASIAFKKVLDDINARRSSIKAGGLYDEYKKGFCELFSDSKFPRQSLITSEADNFMDSETSHKMNEGFPNQCDNSKASSLISNQPQAKSFSKICSSIENTKPNANYLKALETFIKMNKESNKNGGLKPYYLPNSKNRQLVWNDIPLIKPGLSDVSRKTSEDNSKYKPSKMPIKETVLTEKEDNRTLSATQVQKQEPKNLECATKISVRPEPKTQEFVRMPGTDPRTFNPWQEVFSGQDPKQIISGLKAIKQASFFNLVDEYQKQIDNLNQALKTKQSWWKEVLERSKSPARAPIKRNVLMSNSPPGSALPVPFPEVLVNQAPTLGGNNVIDNMASQMNMSPVEMAQRIVGAGQNAAVNPGDARVKFVQTPMQTASQIGSSFKKGPQLMCQVPCQPAGGQFLQQQAPQFDCQEPSGEQMGVSPVLDKILQRLETIQATKCNKSAEEEEEKRLPCCFVDPADGAPCDLNGSWESLVLGVRINIRSPPTNQNQVEEKATCSQHKTNRAFKSRFQRTCVKMNKTQLKEIADANTPNYKGVALNISVQETVPPRSHELLDNLADWHFSGHALMTLGGPLSLSFRKSKSNLIGHFVGYCRTCGCVDTIFGSWTFCQPSRDCQDICMSIVDRRDMLRRYSMDERRKNRFKEQLYMGSKFAKMERERQRVESGAKSQSCSKS
ncbi:uncharacterized protein LOC108099438 [Drosophila ficusphila]|uniref:uncharacterized protein LOC108099438 n=1 Tax=Drosophila ficusphila TaxID=30025 RepID=UPI0007E696C4|nr:uncharacterized protein LOC108099438 [Drosophila ficusphila]